MDTILAGFPLILKRVSNVSRLSSFPSSYRTFSERVPTRSPPDSFIRDVNTAVGIRADIRGRASVRAVSTYPCINRLNM